MPYYTKDPKRDHNFDNHPHARHGVVHDACKCTAVYGSFPQSGAQLQAPNSRDPIIRTATKQEPNLWNSHMRMYQRSLVRNTEHASLSDEVF